MKDYRLHVIRVGRWDGGPTRDDSDRETGLGGGVCPYMFSFGLLGDVPSPGVGVIPSTKGNLQGSGYL